MNTVFGIDLGTTNSAISRYIPNQGPEIIKIDNHSVVPSVVALTPRGWQVGRAARQQVMLDPSSGVTSIKRHMGHTDYRVSLGDSAFSPTEMSSRILAYLKEKAEAAIGETVSDVVITVPAYFKDAERQATIEAGRLAGLSVLRIVNEPTAASLLYPGNDTVEKPEYLLVYDLGGGTFDVSIVRSSGDLKEVIASTGDSQLGGDDFDKLVLEWLLGECKTQGHEDAGKDPQSRGFLRFLAEELKIALSTEVESQVDVVVPTAAGGFPLKTVLSRSQFEGLIEDYIESTIEMTRSVLRDAALSSDGITRLLLVGGSTRIPLVTARLEQEFNWQICQWVDPDLSVSLGAAVQAGIATGLEYKSVVVDVAPHSLGVAAVGELDDDMEDRDGAMPRTFVPLIRRNTPLPARFSETFSKCSPFQRAVEVIVVQGESKVTYENTRVGSFKVKLSDGLDSRIVISFNYTVDGTIKVELAEGGASRITAVETFSLLNVAQEAASSADSAPPQALTVRKGNFLSRKVRDQLRGTPSLEVQTIVDRYEDLLGSDTDELDAMEDQLHEWLEGLNP